MRLNVVNASVTEPVLRNLPLSAGKIEALLNRSSLSPMLLDRPQGLIPLHAGEEFVFNANAISGDPCFTFEIVSQGDASSGAQTANIPVRGADVALDGIKEFASAVQGVLTGTRYWVHLEPKMFWIQRTPGTTAWSDSWALVFYNLGILLRGVRLVLGPDVRPSAIKVACSEFPDHVPEALSGLPLTLGAETTGLGFDRALLARHVGRLPVPADLSVYQTLSSIDGESVTSCLLGLLGSEASDRLADRAARAFGVSRRSYQRQLNRLGTTHRDLVGDARLKLALELLADKSWTVTQIAQELGYRHQGDFTRFFEARMGLSPREMRGKLPIS